MAKQTALQLVNKVLANLGETSNLAALTSLSGLSLLVFNVINEAIYEIAQENNGKWEPLEEDGTITLSQGVTTYSSPSDMHSFDKDSFRYNRYTQMKYYTAQRFDREYPTAYYDTNSSIPDKIHRWKTYFKPYPIPSLSAHTVPIAYRYWKNATVLSTDVPTGTTWIPEGYDLTLLSDLVTYKIMHYKHNEEAAIYYAKVFGDRQENEGSFAKFKSMFASPDLLEENIMVEPM
jgi:hypothetical protein